MEEIEEMEKVINLFFELSEQMMVVRYDSFFLNLLALNFFNIFYNRHTTYEKVYSHTKFF
jgi:hypothetical protein